MPHSIVYNGIPIEKLEKQELILALEAVCGQLEDCKQSAEWWRKKYEKVVDTKPLR